MRHALWLWEIVVSKIEHRITHTYLMLSTLSARQRRHKDVSSSVCLSFCVSVIFFGCGGQHIVRAFAPVDADDDNGDDEERTPWRMTTFHAGARHADGAHTRRILCFGRPGTHVLFIITLAHTNTQQTAHSCRCRRSRCRCRRHNINARIYIHSTFTLRPPQLDVLWLEKEGRGPSRGPGWIGVFGFLRFAFATLCHHSLAYQLYVSCVHLI